MNVEQRYQGALTFKDDESQAEAVEAAEAVFAQHGESFLTMEQIEPLGLHLTISHNGVAPKDHATPGIEVIKTLVTYAYSGYVDVTLNDDETRYHAKEINPEKVRDVNDIIE